MKIFFKSITLVLTISLFFFSCSGENKVAKIGCMDEKADAKTITDKRDINGFTGIQLNNNSSVNIIRDENFSVSVSGKPFSVKRLSTTIVDGNLVIDYAENCEFNKNTIVTVHLPFIKNINLQGSGGINVQGGFRDSNFKAEITGSGDIRIGPLSHFGSSNLKIKGSGNIDAFRSICDDATVNILGSGQIKVSPLNSMNVDITGSGNVIYSGDSTLQMKYSLTGTGKLMKYSK